MRQAAIFVLMMAGITYGQTGPSKNSSAPTQPSLSDTLQWLHGASKKESTDGHAITHIDFDSDPHKPCSVAITETRNGAKPGFWIKESFLLSDIDPVDIYTEKLGENDKLLENIEAIRIHTTNYTEKIIHTSSDSSAPFPTSDYSFDTNYYFAPKFVKAFKHAVELCGGKPSSF